METQTPQHQFARKPLKDERRVRFADTMGRQLVSIFLIDMINTYYFASSRHHKKSLLAPPPPPSLSASHQQRPHQPPSHHQPQQPSSQQRSQQQYQHQKQLEQQQLELDRQRVQQQQQQQQQRLQQAPQPPNFLCEFTQPICLISFKDRVRLNYVHLETCQVNPTGNYVSLSCTIRVRNMAFEKSVTVRYTTDEWHTFADSLASYRPGSCDGWSDKFTATITVKHFPPGQRLIFAIKYAFGSADNVYWDNNGGLNYSIKRV